MKKAPEISSTYLFSGLSPDQQKDIMNIAAAKSFARGQTVFSEGDEGTGFYVILSGRVKVYKLSAEGREQILNIFGPGDSFGEVAVFSGHDFPAHAAADAASRVLFFSREKFLRLVRGNPELALKMLAVLAERLRKFAQLVEGLSLKEVPARLAAYLLFLHEKQGKNEIALDISKTQLASLLGTIPETLSRILGRLSQAGIIETKGSRIRVLDPSRLKEISEGNKKVQILKSPGFKVSKK